MNLGILKCDRVSDAFATEHGQYPEMFAALLLPIEPTLTFTVFDVEQGELPEDIHATDAYLITGSRHGVNDAYPWIAQLEEFVRTLHVSKKKLIGICFGHQLIAKSLGGKVIKSPKGWGVGMSQNQLINPKKWMHRTPERINLLASHQDQVIELPPNAELIAGSDFCPNYMMQIGEHFLSIQGHPEFSKAYAHALMESREDLIDEELFVQAMQSLDLPQDDELMAQWIIHFLQRN